MPTLLRSSIKRLRHSNSRSAMPFLPSLLPNAVLVTITLLGTVLVFVSSNNLIHRDEGSFHQAVNLRGSINIASLTIIPSKKERIHVSNAAARGSGLIHDLSQKSFSTDSPGTDSGRCGSAKSKNLISVARLLNENSIDNEVQSDSVKSSTSENGGELPILSVSTVIEDAVSTELQTSSTPGTNVMNPVDNAADVAEPAGAVASSGPPDSVSPGPSEVDTITLIPSSFASRVEQPIDPVAVLPAADLVVSLPTVEVLEDLQQQVLVSKAIESIASDNTSQSIRVEQPMDTIAEVNPVVPDVATSVVVPTLDGDTVLPQTDIPPADVVVSLPPVEILEDFQQPVLEQRPIDEASSEPSSEFFENAVTFMRSFFDVSKLSSYLPAGSSQPVADNDGKPAQIVEDVNKSNNN